MKEYLCMGCMEKKGAAEVCPHCGYSENAPRIQTYLAPRTVLGGRYLVGRVLSYNGEGVTYLGHDAVLDRKIEIREYFPDALVTRGSNGRSVLVRQGRQIAFKANMSDFIELMGRLSHIRALSCLQQVWDIVEENGTAYAVQEHMEGTLLRDYLASRTVMCTWAEAVDLLLPVIKTLDMIHQEGVIHRGVSPSTIWLNRNGTVKLGGFCISALRAARTELAAELFPGYAAPEQYSAVSPHGTWTDVYAVSALLYTCVTGRCPPEALIRSSRELAPPRECNETVSPRISLAILQGLSLSIDDRIRTLSDLLARISGSAQTGGDSPTMPIQTPRIPAGPAPKSSSRTAPAQTQVMPAVKVTTAKASSSQTKFRPKTIRGTSDRRLLLNSMLITLPVLIVILIITFWYLFGDRAKEETPSVPSSRPVESQTVSRPETSSQPAVSRPEPSSEPSSETSSSPVERMINLVGMQYEDVIANEDYMKLFSLEEPELIYSETDAEGIIVWQSVAVNSMVVPDMVVRVKVSQGSQYIDLPAFEKVEMEEYTARLDELGVRYVIVYTDDSPYPDGYVSGYDSPDGERYDIKNTPLIQVYVSQK